MSTVIRTVDGVSHGATEHLTPSERGNGFLAQTACGLLFASWTYRGIRQGRKNRRKPMTEVPEALIGVVDCMTCLVRAAQL